MNSIIEILSEAVHEKWIQTKLSHGVESRRLETGEELMVPYSDLSEYAKDLDRNSVKAVLEAAESIGYELVKNA